MNEAAALARTLERAVTYRGSKGPTALPEGIKIGGVADESVIWDLLMLDAEENSMAPISEAKVRDQMKICTGRQGGNIVGMTTAPGGGVSGTVGITLIQPWYSDIWCCQEIWMFVHPDHRKAQENYANKLIDFSLWWAEQLAVPIFMGVFSNKRTIGKVRLYARRIPLIGAMFLHQPPSLAAG